MDTCLFYIYRYENTYERSSLPLKDVTLVNCLTDSICCEFVYTILMPFCCAFWVIFGFAPQAVLASVVGLRGRDIYVIAMGEPRLRLRRP